MILVSLLMALQTVHLSPSQRGSNLFDSCRGMIRQQNGSYDPKDAVGAAECLGYLEATVELENMKRFCVKGDFSAATLARVYVLFMEKNPRYLDVLQAEGVIAALRDGYPCSQ